MLKTRYGTSVEFIELLDEYAVISYSDKKVRVLIEDFDSASIETLTKIKQSKEVVS